MWLSLVEYLNGVQVAAGSNPVTPTTSERTLLRSDFSFTKKNQSHAPSFLLFREKVRSYHRTACKRAGLHRFTHYHFFTIPRLRRMVSFLDGLVNRERTGVKRRFFPFVHDFYAIRDFILQIYNLSDINNFSILNS